MSNSPHIEPFRFHRRLAMRPGPIRPAHVEHRSSRRLLCTASRSVFGSSGWLAEAMPRSRLGRSKLSPHGEDDDGGNARILGAPPPNLDCGRLRSTTYDQRSRPRPSHGGMEPDREVQASPAGSPPPPRSSRGTTWTTSVHTTDPYGPLIFESHTFLQIDPQFRRRALFLLTRATRDLLFVALD